VFAKSSNGSFAFESLCFQKVSALKVPVKH